MLRFFIVPPRLTLNYDMEVILVLGWFNYFKFFLFSKKDNIRVLFFLRFSDMLRFLLEQVSLVPRYDKTLTLVCLWLIKVFCTFSMLFFSSFQQIQISLGPAPSHATLCEEGSFGAFFFKFPPEKKKNWNHENIKSEKQFDPCLSAALLVSC